MDLTTALYNYNRTLGNKKQERLSEISEAKKKLLDPGWQDFELGSNTVIDADTLRLGDSGDVRLTGSQLGVSPDAYEVSDYAYAKDPFKLESHKRAYAERYNIKDYRDVNTQDLINEGINQRELVAQKLAEGGQYRLSGDQGVYGRNLAQIKTKDGENIGDFLAQQEHNAGYGSKFNAGTKFDDFESGKFQQNYRDRRDRTKTELATDTAAGLAEGVLTVGEGATFLGGLAGRYGPEGLAARGLGFEKGATEGAMDWLGGKLRAGREYIAENWKSDPSKGNKRLTNEYIKTQNQASARERRALVEAGELSPGQEKLKQITDEFSNALGTVVTNPGYIYDRAIETLPSMLPVTAAGKLSYVAKVKELGKRGIPLTSDIAQAELKKAVGRSSVAAVALTEGASNANETRREVLGMSEAEFMALPNASELLEEAEGSWTKARQKLADKAGDATFVLTGLAAGAVSKVTGAADFEGGLLNPLLRGTAGNAAGEVAEGTLKKAASAVGRGITNTGRETVEEGLQEGGGTAIGNVVAKELYDEDRNIVENVGQATAEGAVIGAGMGAGAATLAGAKRGLGQGVQAAAGAIERRQERTRPVAESVSTADTQQRIRESAEQTPDEAVSTGTVAEINEEELTDVGSVEKYLNQGIEYFRKNPEKVANIGAVVATGNRDLLTQLKEGKLTKEEVQSRVNALANKAKEIKSAASAPEAKVIADTITKLNSSGAEIDLTSPESPVTNADLDTVISAALNGDLSETEIQEINKAKIPESYKARLKTAQTVGNKAFGGNLNRVAAEKLGYYAADISGKTGKTKLGLAGHLERAENFLRVAKETGEPGKLTNQLNSLNTFVTNQKEKLQQIEEEANDPSYVNPVTKKPHTEQFVNQVREEQAIIEEAFNSFVKNYNKNEIGEINALREGLTRIDEQGNEVGLGSVEKYEPDLRYENLTDDPAKQGHGPGGKATPEYEAEKQRKNWAKNDADYGTGPIGSRDKDLRSKGIFDNYIQAKQELAEASKIKGSDAKKVAIAKRARMAEANKYINTAAGILRNIIRHDPAYEQQAKEIIDYINRPTTEVPLNKKVKKLDEFYKTLPGAAPRKPKQSSGTSNKSPSASVNPKIADSLTKAVAADPAIGLKNVDQANVAQLPVSSFAKNKEKLEQENERVKKRIAVLEEGLQRQDLTEEIRKKKEKQLAGARNRGRAVHAQRILSGFEDSATWKDEETVEQASEEPAGSQIQGTEGQNNNKGNIEVLQEAIASENGVPKFLKRNLKTDIEEHKGTNEELIKILEEEINAYANEAKREKAKTVLQPYLDAFLGVGSKGPSVTEKSELEQKWDAVVKYLKDRKYEISSDFKDIIVETRETETGPVTIYGLDNPTKQLKGAFARSIVSQNAILISKTLSQQELKNYLNGDHISTGQKDLSPTVDQKKVVAAYMLEQDQIKFDEIIDSLTDNEAREFIIQHEISHQVNKDGTENPYFVEAEKTIAASLQGTVPGINLSERYLLDSAIIIEARANRDALKKINKYNPTKPINDPDMITTTVGKEKDINVKDRLSAIANEEAILNELLENCL